jgi:hypothetical protein
MRKFSGGAWSNVSIGARGLNSAKGIGLTSFSEFVLGESCDIEALSCILDDLCQTGDGAIEILVSGGEAPYTVSAEGVYQSPHPQAGNAVNISIPIKSGIVDKANFTGLPGNAVYSFTITDAKGCVIE